MIFALGGFNHNKTFLKSTEAYSLETQSWHKLKDLNIERSKPSAFILNDNLYVFGGLTNNAEIHECLSEKFNYNSQ
jgi:N-acetylneuraminic acid mutarotase